MGGMCVDEENALKLGLFIIVSPSFRVRPSALVLLALIDPLKKSKKIRITSRCGVNAG